MAYENMHIHTEAINNAWKLDPCKMGIQNAIPGFFSIEKYEKYEKKRVAIYRTQAAKGKKIVQRKDNFFLEQYLFFNKTKHFQAIWFCAWNKDTLLPICAFTIFHGYFNNSEYGVLVSVYDSNTSSEWKEAYFMGYCVPYAYSYTQRA